MTEEHAASTEPAVPHNGMAHVLEGIQSVHDRLSVIEGLARAAIDGPPPGAPATRVPAWRRPSDGEARWQVTLTTAGGHAVPPALSGRAVHRRPPRLTPP